MDKFIPQIQSNAQQFHSKSYLTLRILRTDLYTYVRFILCLLSVHTDSFRILHECTQKNLERFNGIIFFLAFKGTLVQKTICTTGP
jgi:hypothetical protein